MHNTIVIMVAVVIIQSGCNSVPSSEFLIDKDKGETGRYVVSSDRNYLCHYGRASDMHFQNRFSEQCYKQNKNHLTEHENRSRTYPYFNPSVGAPPGCGPLPVVNGSKWECPYGVSPLSVPVYESCRVLCKGESLQRRTLVKVRCTEKLEWDHPMLSAVCAVIKSSSDNTMSLNSVCTADVGNVQQRNVVNYEDTAKNQLCTQNSDVDNQNSDVDNQNSDVDNQNGDVDKEHNTLSDNDIDLCVSREAFQTSDLADTDIFLQTISNNITVPHATVRNADSPIKCNCILNNMNQNTENIELSNEFNGLDISILTTDSLKNVEENVAIVEDHSWKQSGATRAGSCPTIAAMLEGAVNDSIRFVDDLSTLLDPDNPGNWQGLIQAYFSLSFNKIQEIRHKTKDHFKEAVLPLLSSHGLSIVHLTSYFYKLPSRRIDVIECIQRYHPYCQECGEIYDCVKSSNVE
ncbi:uncharacterized protein LOC128156595 isoform X2 [Crassostrea angulata]|uniref:uncharacterized protein LOC128156595 isoform X2 n=1 Tax=Magallana angulata TaxID=2784310 RepID=UPI0022B20595|nr:uncharacterized protein LOC128156595 isoform X2 [Crassostrea angulata]